MYNEEEEILLTQNVLEKYVTSNASKYWFKYIKAFQNYTIFRLTPQSIMLNKSKGISYQQEFIRSREIVAILKLGAILKLDFQLVYMTFFKIRQQERAALLKRIKADTFVHRTNSYLNSRGIFNLRKSSSATLIRILIYFVHRAKLFIINSNEELWINQFQKPKYKIKFGFSYKMKVGTLNGSKVLRPHGDILCLYQSPYWVYHLLCWFDLEPHLRIN